MNRTKIEYLDFTWNPIVGCTGEGCAARERCWARAQAQRQKHKCPLCYSFTPHLHQERLNQPFKRKRSAIIGLCFSADFFDINVQPWWRDMVYHTIRLAPQHIFVCLTKQPSRCVGSMFNDYPLDNFWLGVSVNRKEDLWRLEELRDYLRVKHKLVSFEPLYEDLASQCNYDALDGIDWIIIGAQQKPNLQPDPQWVENLIGLSNAAGNHVAVFLKNNLHWPEKLQEFPEKYMNRGI